MGNQGCCGKTVVDVLEAIADAQNKEIRLVTFVGQKTVEKLEVEDEEAIAEVIVKMGLGQDICLCFLN